MASSDAKIAKIQTNFQVLAEVSISINSASDELTKTVSVVDESLKKLNIGLTAWVLFYDRGSEDDLPHYDHYEIGYSKVGGVWGIAIRHVWGDWENEDRSCEGPWLFNDAARDLRIQSVDYLPEVIEELAKEASDTTKRIQKKTIEVRELASAIENIAKRPSPPPKPPAPPNRTPQPPPAPPAPPSLSTLAGNSKAGSK